MCWSGEASTVLATVGLASTGYAALRKEPTPLWAALGYFSLMEALQAYTYTVIDECSNPANQIATFLGYIHIVFQPFFGNALALYFIPEKIQQRIAPSIYTMCFFSAVFMLIELYPFNWAGACNVARVMCAERLCSVSGNWHIAWEIPFNGIGNYFITLPALKFSFISYAFVMFILPFLYGSWRMTLYHLFMGPMIAELLTSNKNEWPAVWCLLTIGFLLIVVKTPVRRLLHVRRWPLWPRSLLEPPLQPTPSPASVALSDAKNQD